MNNEKIIQSVVRHIATHWKEYGTPNRRTAEKIAQHAIQEYSKLI